MTKSKTSKVVISALCLALCILLPYLTGQIKEIGNMLCPMHIPVLLCGYIAGPFYGMAVGAVAPILRGFLCGAPVLMPTGFAMSFELAVYGLVSGLLYNRLKGQKAVYISLMAAMLCGRIVWGIVMKLLSGISLKMFLTAAFINAVPGIILQLLIIPPIVIYTEKYYTRNRN